MRTNKQKMKNFKMNDLFDNNNNNNNNKDNETMINVILTYYNHSKWIQAIKLEQILILL